MMAKYYDVNHIRLIQNKVSFLELHGPCLGQIGIYCFVVVLGFEL